MKRVFSALMALSVISSCARLETSYEPEVLDVVSPSTKVQLDNGMHSVWTAGDRVSVFYKSLDNEAWDYSGATGSKEGTITHSGARVETTSDIVAIYPYNEAAAFNGSMIYTKTPDTQYYQENSFGAGSVLMWAKASGSTLNFEYLSSLVRLDLTGDVKVSAVVFEGLAGEKVSGDTWIDVSADKPVCYVRGEGAGRSIRLVRSDGTPVQLSSDTATSFYIAIPAISYEKGYRITVEYEGGSSSLSVGPDITAVPGEIHPLELGIATDYSLALDFTGAEFPMTGTDVPTSTVVEPYGDATSTNGRVTSSDGDEFIYTCDGKTYPFTICASDYYYTGKVWQAGYYWSSGKFLRFQSANSWIRLPKVEGKALDSVSMAITNSSNKTFYIGTSTDDQTNSFTVPAQSSFKCYIISPQKDTRYYLYTVGSHNSQISKLVLNYR